MKFPKIELIYNTSKAYKMIAEAISQQWKQNLGIDIVPWNMEWKVIPGQFILKKCFDSNRVL